MNKTQLITALRAHLADKEDIANEAAPALALMRYAVVELEKPTSGGGGDTEQLRRELDDLNTAAGSLHAQLADRDGYLYSLLADLGMVPEVDEEPVDSLAEAIELAPGLLDDLQMKVASLYATSDDGDDDKDRFIDGVRKLLDGEILSLQGLWELLESKAQYLEGLEKGIEERDQQIAEADKQLSGAEWLKAIVEQIILIMRLDWQDVEQLPQDIQKLRDDANAMLKAQNFAVSGSVPLAGWVTDAIDLAHAVRGNLAPENRVMAKAAEAIILNAPGGKDA